MNTSHMRSSRPTAGRLGWGILGTARVSRHLIPAVRATATGELVAVASRQAATAEAYARTWRIPRWYAGYERLLADPDIDLVYIPLPNSLHAEWVLRSLDAGKHVLCEKPLALTADDVEAMASASAATERLVTEAFVYRSHPQTLTVKEIVDKGTLGRLRCLIGSFTYRQSRPADVRLDPTLGGGSLWDVGCYVVSYAQFLLGQQPVEVAGWQERGPTGVDVAFAGRLVFPNDVVVQFDCGFEAPLRTSIEIVGTRAVLRVDHPFKPARLEHLRIDDGTTEHTIEVAGRESFVEAVDDLMAAVREARPPRVSLADSRAVVATIEALYRSAREGRERNGVRPHFEHFGRNGV